MSEANADSKCETTSKSNMTIDDTIRRARDIAAAQALGVGLQGGFVAAWVAAVRIVAAVVGQYADAHNGPAIVRALDQVQLHLKTLNDRREFLLSANSNEDYNSRVVELLGTMFESYKQAGEQAAAESGRSIVAPKAD